MVVFDPDSWSPKQSLFMEKSYAPVNVCTGAVQSGKTWITNQRFGYYVVFESPHDRFLLTGNTTDTIHRNVIDNGLLLFCNEVLGEQRVKYATGGYLKLQVPHPEDPVELWEKIIWIVGVNNKASEDRLKGTPIGGTLMDELTTYPRQPAQMAFARNSLAGSLVFATTNPGPPTHWAWKDLVGNTEKQENGLVNVFHFTLHDNPTMTEEKIHFYEGLFEGVFYRRNILGEWVMAEGAIYDMFDEPLNTFAESPFQTYDDAFISMDYGTSSVTTFAYWKVKRSIEGNHHYHCFREWYYDARDTEKRMTDSQVVDALYSWMKTGRKDGWLDIEPVAFFVDPNATSIIEELMQYEVIDSSGLQDWPFMMTFGAPNAVIPGINRVSNLIAGRFMRWHQSCNKGVAEHQGYVWDEGARASGVDRPLKFDDHCPDRDRYGIMGYERYFGYTPASFGVSNTGSRILSDRVVGRRVI